MKVWIECEEKYPNYVFFVEGETQASAEFAVEVDPETYARWVQVKVQYDDMQQELEALAEAQHKKWQQSIVDNASREQWHASMSDVERYGRPWL